MGSCACYKPGSTLGAAESGAQGNPFPLSTYSHPAAVEWGKPNRQGIAYSIVFWNDSTEKNDKECQEAWVTVVWMVHESLSEEEKLSARREVTW